MHSPDLISIFSKGRIHIINDAKILKIILLLYKNVIFCYNLVKLKIFSILSYLLLYTYNIKIILIFNSIQNTTDTHNSKHLNFTNINLFNLDSNLIPFSFPFTVCDKAPKHLIAI